MGKKGSYSDHISTPIQHGQANAMNARPTAYIFAFRLMITCIAAAVVLSLRNDVVRGPCHRLLYRVVCVRHTIPAF